MTTGWILAFAMGVVGVDYGWQPAAGGGTEYVIQLDQLAVDALIDGAEVTSIVLPEAQHVKGFRIRVGKEQLPQENGAAIASFEEADAAAKTSAKSTLAAEQSETIIRGQNAGTQFQTQIPVPQTSTLPSQWQSSQLRANITPISGQTAQQPGVSLDSNGLQIRSGGYNTQLSLPAPPNTQSVLTTNNQQTGSNMLPLINGQTGQPQQAAASPGPLVPPVAGQQQPQPTAVDNGWSRSQFSTGVESSFGQPNVQTQPQPQPQQSPQLYTGSQFATSNQSTGTTQYQPNQYVDPRTQQPQANQYAQQSPALGQPQLQPTNPIRSPYEQPMNQQLNSPYSAPAMPRADLHASNYEPNWNTPNTVPVSASANNRFANNSNSNSLFNPDGFNQREVNRPADYTQPARSDGSANVVTPAAATGTPPPVHPVGGAQVNGLAAGQANLPLGTVPLNGEQPRPWGALMMSLLFLFASLGGNIYLGWIAWESYLRYRRVLIEGDIDASRRARRDVGTTREERY